MMNITLLEPIYLLFIVLFIILWYFYYKKSTKIINFLFFQDVKKIFRHNNFFFYLKIIILSTIFILYVILLANPNIINTKIKEKKNGIDIAIILDLSLSMESQDLQPNRIESAKSVIKKFIGKLKTDRLGMVLFAGKPFVSIPLTFDYNMAKESIDNISTDTINQQRNWLNGTAIWDALIMAKNLFKTNEKNKDDNREKVIILLTDGDANVGVDPVLAAKMLRENNIKIYTIGIGSKKWGYITYNIWGFQQRQQIPPLKEKELREIANIWRWKFFRADNNYTFQKIFDELSSLEKNDIEIEAIKNYRPYYKPFAFSLIILLILFYILETKSPEKTIW